MCDEANKTSEASEAINCGPDGSPCCCKIEAVVSVDERGQMVLPKDIRERAGIKAGDKLAVVTMSTGDTVACIALLKAGEMEEMVKNMIGPMMNTIFGNK